MSVSETESIPPPPLTEENIAAGPAPGYSYLPIDVTQVYSGMTTDHPMFTQQLIYAELGGSVYFPAPHSIPGQQEYMTWWHGVTIPPEALAENLVITMLVPDPEYAVVDFGPHPYFFDPVNNIARVKNQDSIVFPKTHMTVAGKLFVSQSFGKLINMCKRCTEIFMYNVPFRNEHNSLLPSLLLMEKCVIF